MIEFDPELLRLKKEMLKASSAYYARVHDLTLVKIKSCKHDWVDQGPYRDDDVYECHKCGKMEFR